MNNRLILLLAAAFPVAQVGVGGVQIGARTVLAQAANNEAKQIEILKSGAAFKEKQDACRALALYGTKESVPALAALLPDEKLSHMARYALEQIKDPVADAALRDALGVAKGLPLIGVIGSIGNVRDAKAIEPLGKLLSEGDAGVVDAAAHALGRIGGVAAIKPLMAASAKATPGIYDGMLRCAETLPQKDAIAMYDAIRKPSAPQWVRMAGMRGAILSRQEQGIALISEALHGEDYALTLAAMRAARELSGTAVTKALAAELGKVEGDRQYLLVQVLGDRRDTVAGPQLLTLAKNSDGKLRDATVKALVQVRDVAAIPLLADLSVADDEVGKTARSGLAGFTGREADAPIAAMLKSPNVKARLVATDLVVQRRMTQTMPQLLLGATDADAALAAASLSALGSMGGAAEVPAMVKILTGGTALQASENALTAMYMRTRDASLADALAAALPQAATPAKLTILRVLRRIGSPKALAEMRLAMADPNAEIRENAIRNLTDWQTADAIPDLMKVATTPPSPALKILALRGVLRLVPQQAVTPDQKVASVKAALALVERPEEKRLALAALGEIPTAESLALVVPELSNPALKGEASLAAVAIGQELTKTQPAVVSDAMALVVKATEDKQVIKRAEALMRKP